MLNNNLTMIAYLKQVVSSLQIEVTPVQYDQYLLFYEYLLDINKKINLTRITEPMEFATKHLGDSLTLFKAYNFPRSCSIIDIGTGAGIPGIPLAILRPDLKITLVDSLRKRTQFISEVLKIIRLNNVEVVHDRAEYIGQSPLFREKIEVVISRAVAPLNILSEICLPFLTLGGCFLAMKGPKAPDEIKLAKRAIDRLGGGIVTIYDYKLPLLAEDRVIIRIDKERCTPRLFPRKPGIPERQPLI